MRRAKRGFTLAELMIAAAILTVAIAGLLSLFVTCQLLNESNNDTVRAVNDAQYVLEQIKSLTYSGISTYTAPVMTNLPNENITLTRSIGAAIAEVTVNVSWKEKQRNRTYNLTTRIAK